MLKECIAGFDFHKLSKKIFILAQISEAAMICLYMQLVHILQRASYEL